MTRTRRARLITAISAVRRLSDYSLAGFAVPPLKASALAAPGVGDGKQPKEPNVQWEAPMFRTSD
jgi:hypothetical protein